MKLFFLLVVFSLFLQGKDNLQESVVSKAKYPVVSGLIGKVSLSAPGGNLPGGNLPEGNVPEGNVNLRKRPLRLKEILKEKALLQTQEKSQVRIELDAHTSLLLLPNSELEIPVIGFEHGEVQDILLLRGRLRVQAQDLSERYYATPITRDIYKQADFVLAYDAAKTLAKVQVIAGKLDFRGLENEKSYLVSAGESAVFSGVSENDEPAFDILLHGRRVARGKITQPPTALTQIELAEMAQATLLQKSILQKSQQKPARGPGQICDAPFGKLNECIWRCQGIAELKKQSKRQKSQHQQPQKKPLRPLKTCDVSLPELSCVRQRCLANGLWGDPQILPTTQNQCDLQPRVGPCDY